MAIGGGFGPSTGRIVEVNESSETRVEMNTKPTPPVVSILAFTAAFLCFVFGTTLVYENEKILGSILLIVVVILVALGVVWTTKNR